MKNKEFISLKKMLDYIDKAFKYTKDCTYDTFNRNEEKIDATIFAISQIGELIKNIDKETQAKYSTIEWNILKGLRNKIVHDYEGINVNIIWDIIQNDLNPLKNKIENVLNEERKKV